MHSVATSVLASALFGSGAFASTSSLSNPSLVALLTSRTVMQWFGNILALVGTGFFVYIVRWTIQSRKQRVPFAVNVQARDPSLLQNNTTVKSYATPYATYPKIRTFFHQHPQAEKLPREPKPLPAIIFFHGLGGSLAQFVPLMTGLVNVAPCFGIDLPGCGKSDFAPQEWSAYSHPALVALLDAAIDEACAMAEVQEVVLLCHSMGCSLAASLLAGSSSTITAKNAQRIKGVVALCPKAATPSAKEVKAFRRILNIPTPIFDLFRAWDRRGGVRSASVSRFVGDSASIETKKLQLRFNEQSKTPVWRRMAAGAVPSLQTDGSLSGGLPGPEVWGKISIPLLLIAGESDHVTKPSEIAIITKAMGRDANDNKVGRDRKAPFKTVILPSPASHGLLYDHATYRTVSGLILTFLSDHIQKELSMSWQLQYLKETNMWDVKNLAKWQSIAPVSASIGDTFRAMKTLRESDDKHSPLAFAAAWGSQVKAVVDISQTQPVYNPHDLEKGGIEYHKFPTVSKVPPTPEEVKDFISLIDQLRLEEGRAVADGESKHRRLIAVHCHYGFNRTGFFICSYLIEREGFSVQKAVDEFAAARPPGIRHEHFLDALFVRYHVGLKRAPTM